MTDDPVTTLDAQDPPEDVPVVHCPHCGQPIEVRTYVSAIMKRPAETDASRITWRPEEVPHG